MINFIWMFLIVTGVIFAGLQGRMEVVTISAISSAEAAVTLAIKLTGVMCLWLGIIKIAEAAGMVRYFAALLTPVIRVLFPSIPKKHPALGAIIMTISANMLGLGNAVTPLGIKSMQELQKLNHNQPTASPAMCTLLALCTTGFTLIPATVIALRSAAGSVNPTETVGATILVSMTATIVVLMVDWLCRTIFCRK